MQHWYILFLGERIYTLAFTFRQVDGKYTPEVEDNMIKNDEEL